MSTFEFEDQSRVERLTGTLHAPGATTGNVLTVNADKSISPAPGGGSQPHTTGVYNITQSLSAGGNARGSWTHSMPSDALLDLTDPLNPAVVDAGTYAITGLYALDGVAPVLATDLVDAQLWMDANGFGQNFGAAGRCLAPLIGTNGPVFPLNGTLFIPAAGALAVYFDAGQSSADCSLSVELIVQRLS